MIFRPELAAKVLGGSKIVTRRGVKENPRSPWYRHGGPVVGKDYAVCPGRSQFSIGRIEVVHADIRRLGQLSAAAARGEGFDSVADSVETFAALNGGIYDPEAEVWRVVFRLIEEARRG